MKFLITGGAGYIGSTISSALEDNGHIPVILDSLVTGRPEFTRGRIFYQADIADESALERVLNDHPDIHAVVHCAAIIVVPESVAKPFEYYYENVYKSLIMFRALNRLGCNRLVFSSSASLYDLVPGFMVTESAPLRPLSPYARTKYMMEMILQDFCVAYGMRAISLRYFNPIGADPQMRSGPFLPNPSLVLNRLVETAAGRLPVFEITGVDLPTHDGTGIRDYIHVWDLARAHVAALADFDRVFERAGNPKDGYLVINLGTGQGVTVREMVAAFEKIWGKPIHKCEAPPRPGDAVGAYANADKALQLLGWKAEHSLEDGIRDALRWNDARKQMLGY